MSCGSRPAVARCPPDGGRARWRADASACVLSAHPWSVIETGQWTATRSGWSAAQSGGERSVMLGEPHVVPYLLDDDRSLGSLRQARGPVSTHDPALRGVGQAFRVPARRSTAKAAITSARIWLRGGMPGICSAARDRPARRSSPSARCQIRGSPGAGSPRSGRRTMPRRRHRRPRPGCGPRRARRTCPR